MRIEKRALLVNFLLKVVILRTTVISLFLLLIGFFIAPYLVFAETTLSLTTPTPPAVSKTFVWKVNTIKPLKSREIASINFSGCWEADDMEKIVVKDKNGSVIQLNHLKNQNVYPVSIAVTFHKAYGSAENAIALTYKDGASTVKLAAAGPTCNQQPTAEDISVTTNEDTPVTVHLTASDPNDTTLAFSIKDQPQHGSLGAIAAPSCMTASGTTACTTTVSYTPHADYHGTDSFTYTINDGFQFNGQNASLTAGPAVVSVKINEGNDAPIFTNDQTNTNQTINIGEGLTALKATDGDNDPLTFSLREGTLPQGIALNANGSFTGTAASNSAGMYSVVVSVSDGKDGTAETSLHIVVIKPNTAPEFTADQANTQQTIEVGQSLAALKATDADNDSLSYILKIGELPPAITLNQDGTFSGSASAATVGDHSATIEVSDGNGGTDETILAVTVEKPEDPLPPDPKTVAPPISQFAYADFEAANRFLYTGTSPIQTDVAAGAIDDERVAVLRGKVETPDGNPLPGVTITVNNHTEFGQTLSRADGMFDIAANGGGVVTLSYELQGYLPVQRSITVPILEYSNVPDVVLTPVDMKVSQIDLMSNQPIQTAQGNQVTDLDGTRQATMLFQQGTSAEMVLPDGIKKPLTSLNVRATEYTVGPRGLDAMPAELPPSSGYTYAVELSVDEAIASGASEVTFSKPLSFYVENFIGFPVGGSVPAGYYDRGKAQWIPSRDGRVIKILAITEGKAVLDVKGTGLPATTQELSGLSITDAELVELAKLYTQGTSLWRVQMTHFTPWDLNWPYGPPDDATAPDQLESPDERDDESDTECGSIIDCQNQALGEVIPVNGTPYSLNYTSERMQGNKSAYVARIPITGATIPSSLHQIYLIIEVAGRYYIHTFEPKANLTHTFTWDGTDIYGRKVNGRYKMRVDIGYRYFPVYRQPAQIERSFARFGTTPITGTRMQSLTIWQIYHRLIGTWVDQKQTPDGWSINSHHAYDPVNQVIFFGDGRRYETKSLNRLITTIAGNGTIGYSGDGGHGSSAQLSSASDTAVSPDGSIYIADTGNHRIRKVNKNGVISTVVGTGTAGFSGDGGLATAAKLHTPSGIAFGPDGSLYIADTGNLRIRKVSPQGSISTIAGSGTIGNTGDGGIATAATFMSPAGIAVDKDGSVIVSDGPAHVIRKIGTDGIISRIAGIGAPGFAGDGGLAINARLFFPMGIDIDANGTLYVADRENRRIRKIDQDGTIDTFAGNGFPTYGGDGGKAINASIHLPFGVAVSPNGSVFITDSGNSRIRRVSTDSMITTVAGTGERAYGGDGNIATAAKLDLPMGISAGKDGSFYFVDRGNSRVRKVDFAVFNDNITLVSEDGTELYIFDDFGKHLRTLDALTNAVIYTYAYDADGYLKQIADADNNITTIERNEAHLPTAIVAPFGQRTALTHTNDKLLATVTNPANETYQFSYGDGGLLEALVDPRQEVSRFTYDSLGRLTKDEDAEEGFKALSRTETQKGYTITLTTALGRTTKYEVEFLPANQTRKTQTDPAGNKTVSITDVSNTTRTTFPDGTITTQTESPDPRWGMLSPIISEETRKTPNGLLQTITRERLITLSDPTDKLSLQTLTDKTTTNGQTLTQKYESATKTITSTTHVGRQTVTTLNNKGRLIKKQIAGFAPTQNTFDAQGRLTTITEGTAPQTRTTTITYSTKNHPETLTDALGKVTNYEYDNSGRLTKQTLPGGRVTTNVFDANGNITSLTPPGKPAHGFVYNGINFLSEYSPPDVAQGTTKTTYEFDKDRNKTLVTRPDGKTVGFTYDSAGRLHTLDLPETKNVTHEYSSTTGLVTKITAADTTTLSYLYDGQLLKRETVGGTGNGTTDWNYDNNFNVTSIAVNSGNTISYTYDQDNLLTKAGNLTLTRSAQNGYITGTALGNVTTSQTYTAFGELQEYKASYSGTPVFSMQLTKDDLGRVSKKIETSNSQPAATYDYTYNEVGQLTDVFKNAVKISHYGYDANGNRLTVTDKDNNTVSGTYDGQDRLTAYGDTTYAYTANGELASKTDNGQTTTYEYDVLGNLKKVQLPNATQIEYIVDGTNRRIGKKVNGTVTQRFLYESQLNIAAELDSNGSVISRFVYASKSNVPDFMIKSGKTYRIISDHVGSPRLVIDTATGDIAQELDYDAFGVLTKDTNTGFQPFGFASGLYDGHTKLIRFGARDYDPQTGRWTAKDPILFAGSQHNVYSYVDNDPINKVDPSGLQALLCEAPPTLLDCSRETANARCQKGTPADPICTKDTPVGERCLIPANGTDPRYIPSTSERIRMLLESIWSKLARTVSGRDHKYEQPRRGYGGVRG